MRTLIELAQGVFPTDNVGDDMEDAMLPASDSIIREKLKAIALTNKRQRADAHADKGEFTLYYKAPPSHGFAVVSAYKGDRIVGSFQTNGGTGTFDQQMIVDREFRRLGLGRSMVGYAEQMGIEVKSPNLHVQKGFWDELLSSRQRALI